MAEELPDAPWAISGKSDLPDAPWATKAESPIGTVEDVAKSAATGAAKGVIAIPGMAGDIGQLGTAALQSGTEALGLTKPQAPPQQPPVGSSGIVEPGVEPIGWTPRFGLPTSAGIQKAVEAVTGPFHKPETTAGEYVQAAGEMLPAAATGPGGLLRRTVGAVGAGLAGESATHIPGVKGSELEPAARVLGAVVPSAVAGSLARQAAPTAQQLEAGYRSAYNRLRNQNVLFDKRDTDYLADSIERGLLAEGYRRTPNIAGTPVFHAIDELREMRQAATEGRSPNFHDIDAVRKSLNIIGKSREHSDAVRRAKDAIDQFTINVAGTQQARGDYAAAMRNRTVTDIMQRATDQAARTGTGANIDNATRQQVSRVLNSPRLRRGFNADEIAQMREIVRGSTVGNVLRYFGRLAPTGIVSGAGSVGLGELVGGAKGMVGLPLVGLGAKMMADRMTRGAVENLGATVRARSPTGQAMGASPAQFRQRVRELQDAAFMRALLASQGGQ